VPPIYSNVLARSAHGYHGFEHSCKHNGYIGMGGGRDTGISAGAESTAFHER